MNVYQKLDSWRQWFVHQFRITVFYVLCIFYHHKEMLGLIQLDALEPKGEKARLHLLQETFEVRGSTREVRLKYDEVPVKYEEVLFRVKKTAKNLIETDFSKNN